jgi:hypothetical protein
MYSYTNVKKEIYEYKSHARQWDETTRQTVAINLSKFGPKTLWTGHKIGIQIFHETKNRSWKFIRNINAHFFSCSSYFKLTHRFVDWGGLKWCGLVRMLPNDAPTGGTAPAAKGPSLRSPEPGLGKRLIRAFLLDQLLVALKFMQCREFSACGQSRSPFLFPPYEAFVGNQLCSQ